MSSAASNLQWLRQAQVVVGTGGKGLSIQDLKIVFQITKTVQPNPNPAVIKIYNLNPDHENLIKYEYTDILLNAGYLGQTRLIFTGNVKQVYRYQQGNDFVTEITAGDGDQDYRQALMNTTLAAGTTDDHLVNAAVASFSSTTKGHVSLPARTRIRGQVVSGNTRKVLDELARNAGANWSIQDGQLVIVKTDSVLPGDAVVLNSDSGLLSVPEVNDKGITLRCLLNPQLRVNGVIQLDNNNVKLKVKKSTGHGSKAKVAKPVVKLDPDGLYKLIKVVHQGDTRGEGQRAWVSNLTCVGLSQPIPSSATSENATGVED